ncbi:hypothetical protein BFP70_17160 [Thioclava sp. SK-1]|uniref:SapC family protein n=1 Tax=Thioclava sp. SK-1 TaxID=1889770 RepID=UPI000824A8F4|nr:SapC family protein [Thioclava sp. SK-1]OCX61169.1 hypothetical protein BFP70_17160 [Thioclava sp. SK-1]
MSNLPMFYKSVVAVSRQDHLNHRIAPSRTPFKFAAGSHLIPCVVDEFAAASGHLPIVFAPTETGFASVFLCGSHSGVNQYVDADGGWTKGYLPAYLRRYPFILGEQADTNALVCVDSAFTGLVEAGEGQRLFGDDGNQTAFTEAAIKLITDYAIAAKRTEAVLKMLADMKLFRSVNIEARDAEGVLSSSLHGLCVIDEKALNELPDEEFLKLRTSGILPLIYAHLMSLANISKIAVPAKAAA